MGGGYINNRTAESIVWPDASQNHCACAKAGERVNKYVVPFRQGTKMYIQRSPLFSCCPPSDVHFCSLSVGEMKLVQYFWFRQFENWLCDGWSTGNNTIAGVKAGLRGKEYIQPWNFISSFKLKPPFWSKTIYALSNSRNHLINSMKKESVIMTHGL